MSMSVIEIYTIGHSNHSLIDFLNLLSQHQIGSLVDIRRHPASRRHPHFNREHLTASVEEVGIGYHWLEALGGNRKRAKDAPPSSNRGIADEAFRNYADYMASDEFRQGVARLMEIAGGQPAAIMCAEGDYRRCHRQLVSDYLVANGVTVQHILPSGEVQPHTLTAQAKVVDGSVIYPGQPTLFDLDGK